MRRIGGALVAVLLSTVLTGCSSADRSDVDAVVKRFYAAFDQKQGAEACALLAPATRSEVEQSAGAPCASALLDEKVPRPGQVTRTSVYGDQAQVRLDSDTAFVARFPGGWRIVAVGCDRRPGRPYDCDVEAG
jgi:hypothetical protein